MEQEIKEEIEQEFKQYTGQEFKLPKDYKSKHKGRRVSPQGMIDLPLDARLTLGFIKGTPKVLKVQVAKNEIRFSPEGEGQEVKSSPRGLLRLPSDAHKILSNTQKGQYHLTIDMKKHAVYLRPA
jgi:hypothetical protein